MSCAEARRQLEKLGILMLQDKKLPSVTTIFAGEPMSRSWWSHPRSHEIFLCLEKLEEHALVTRLIGGKVTYVHRRLWPALAAAGVAVDDDEHTPSGRHERHVEPAKSWAKRLDVQPLASAAEARTIIEAAVAGMGGSLSALPWYR